jgi:hypothetical protein
MKAISIAALPLLACVSNAYAALPNPPPASPLTSWVLWALIGYATRHKKIGGWLLYFYAQLYLSALVQFFFLSNIASNLAPSTWADKAVYGWYVVSVIPAVALFYAQVVAATILLGKRNERMLSLVRKIMVAYAVASGIALVIDGLLFNDDGGGIVLDVMTTAFAVIWATYFFRSARVRRVFVLHDWVGDPKAVKRTPAERSYVVRRTFACVGVTLLLVVAFAIATGGLGALADSWIADLLLSLLVAALAWWAPISQKKRAALTASPMCPPGTVI